jgi:RimJ/RimL family protein N-acetyltransferase
MQNILQTNRLILRQFTTDDAAFIVELLNSPGWIQYIGDRNIKTEEQAKVYLENGPIKSYEKNGFGLSLVALLDGTPIGMCGIIRRDTLDYPDIGFAFLPKFVGMGYAYEIADATMQQAKEIWNLPTILGITLPNNISSIKLLEKIGLHYVEPYFYPESDEELMLFSN